LLQVNRRTICRHNAFQLARSVQLGPPDQLRCRAGRRLQSLRTLPSGARSGRQPCS